MHAHTDINTIPFLGPWQKRQAAMLYHFSSVEYLEPLHKMVTDIVDKVADPAIALAKAQGRDRQLVSKKWGARDTSQNWANNAWPFLKDLQSSLAGNIATRRNGEYQRTDISECVRGIDEYSTDWMTDQEESKLKQTLATLSRYALPHDHTLDSYQNSWDDFTFILYFQSFSAKHLAIPKFAVQPEISALTGELAPKTGVYIAHGDPHATLQFVWTNPRSVRLREAKTFNEIGLAALAEVGRNELWRNESKMFNFAMHEKYASLFRHWIIGNGQPYISAAPATVASGAFQSVPRKWSLVEIVPDEWEALDDSNIFGTPNLPTDFDRLSIKGGEPCQHTGYYFTPSAPGSRRLMRIGDIAPMYSAGYGTTYWQWDDKQNGE